MRPENIGKDTSPNKITGNTTVHMRLELRPIGSHLFSPKYIVQIYK